MSLLAQGAYKPCIWSTAWRGRPCLTHLSEKTVKAVAAAVAAGFKCRRRSYCSGTSGVFLISGERTQHNKSSDSCLQVRLRPQFPSDHKYVRRADHPSSFLFPATTMNGERAPFDQMANGERQTQRNPKYRSASFSSLYVVRACSYRLQPNSAATSRSGVVATGRTVPTCTSPRSPPRPPHSPPSPTMLS